MRRRKVKGADEKLLSYKDYVVRDNIESLKGNWNQLFKNDNPIHAEFGTGRGKFLTTLAKQNPDINYNIVLGQNQSIRNIADQKMFVIKNDINFLPAVFSPGRKIIYSSSPVFCFLFLRTNSTTIAAAITMTPPIVPKKRTLLL